MEQKVQKIDIYQRSTELEAERRRLEDAPIGKANREAILAFCDDLRANSLSPKRVLKHSTGLRLMAQRLEVDFETATKRDLKRLVASIYADDRLTEITKADYKQMLKQFYRYFKGDGEETPRVVRWIKGGAKKKDRQFGEMIHHDEFLNLLYCTEEPRDKAFIAFLYESGARIDEVLNLRIKDFKPHERYVKVRLYGKTGERWVVVVLSAPLIMKYLEKHPRKAPLQAARALASSIDCVMRK